MTAKKPVFLNPNIESSDDEDGDSLNGGGRKISNKIKKTRTNKNAIKNPNTYSNQNVDEEDDDDEVVISDDDSPKKSGKTRKRKPDIPTGKKKGKRPKKSDSDDDFLPEDDKDDSGNDDVDDEDEESVTSEISGDNISDSDFNPDDEEEVDADQDESDIVEGESTINISDDAESPDKKEATKTFDPNSKEFWDKVQELRSKGFSIQQSGDNDTKKGAVVTSKNVPTSPIRGKMPANLSRLSAFTNLVINFDHEKRCIRKCFLMDPKQKQTLSEINSPQLLTPEFIKGCIKIINCNTRLGEVEPAKDAINMTSNLGSIPGVSALCQAMISGVKAQLENIAQLSENEKEGMSSLKTKEYTKALELLDKCLLMAGSCLRLKMARGDCLAHLGRYVEGAKAASSILQQDQRNVGALFLRGFCLYHKNNIDRALTHFQQVLQISKDHERAKTLLNKAKHFKARRDEASKASTDKRYTDAEKFLTEALAIDPRNKGTNANLLAERAEVYFNMQEFDKSVDDCEASLKQDQSCLAAMLMRARCHIQNKEWDQAVRIMERMNSRDRHNQQGKLKAAEAAQKSGNHAEAFRLHCEAVDVDKHNQKYRHLLREAKQQLLLQTRVDHYAILGIEKTVGESEIRKAYFKKSKEYHPDKHANKSDEEKEEFSKKFKLAKEAYEILSDNDKRKMFDSGRVKAPPGGWYQDVDRNIAQQVQMRGGIRGRGPIRGIVRGTPVMRGNVTLRQPIMRANVRPVMRGAPIRVQQVRGGVRIRPGVRPVNVRPGMRPGQPRPVINGRPTLVRPVNVTRSPMRGAANGIRPNMNPRPRLNGISITPLGSSSRNPEIVDVHSSSLPSFSKTWGESSS